MSEGRPAAQGASPRRQRRGRRWRLPRDISKPKKSGRWGLAVLVLLAAGWGAGDRWVATAPLPDLGAPVSAVVTDRAGEALRVFLAADDRWRLPVALGQVDPGYLAMLLAYEDKRYRRHPGVDPLAIGRAALGNLASGRVTSGGSTLTMQVARLLGGEPTRDLRAKLAQIRLALALERRLSKDEILEIYLQRAPFGGNIEGVRAAAWSYFGKEPRRLSAAEAALLVALPQAPEARRPDRDPDAARAARARVLARAEAAGVIDARTKARALAAPLPGARLALPDHAWHLAQDLHSAAPDQPVLPTTLKGDLQRAAEVLLARGAQALPPGVSAAAMVQDIASGETLARVGALFPGAEARGGFIDMTRALRSPGSTLKPFVYALAFARGAAHPETIVDDRPRDFRGYRPENFDGTWSGPVSLRHALQRSLNVPAVAVLDEIGPGRLTAYLRATGAAPVTPGARAPGLALALGGAGLSLESLMGAYGELARAAQGAPGTALIDRRAAWYVTDILRGAPAPLAAAGGEIAFKTGTSYGYRDAWAIGFDGRHLVGVWIGRPDGGAVPGLSGLQSAAPILFGLFDRLGPRRAPLPAAPPDALLSGNAALPPPLRRLGPVRPATPEPPALSLAYPPEGARLVLGEGRAGRLVAKIGAGQGPFTWLVDGRVVPSDGQARSLVWEPAGAGYVTITVLDAQGRAARRTVLLDRP